jgi:hypothetical protein
MAAGPSTSPKSTYPQNWVKKEKREKIKEKQPKKMCPRRK